MLTWNKSFVSLETDVCFICSFKGYFTRWLLTDQLHLAPTWQFQWYMSQNSCYGSFPLTSSFEKGLEKGKKLCIFGTSE